MPCKPNDIICVAFLCSIPLLEISGQLHYDSLSRRANRTSCEHSKCASNVAIPEMTGIVAKGLSIVSVSRLAIFRSLSRHSKPPAKYATSAPTEHSSIFGHSQRACVVTAWHNGDPLARDQSVHASHRYRYRYSSSLVKFPDSKHSS